MATHASNAVNKWLRRDFGGLTCHCLRHTLRDRLRAVEAPIDLIDQTGGWASVGGIGVAYGKVSALRIRPSRSGADIVAVSPPTDDGEATALAAATVGGEDPRAMGAREGR